MLTNEQIQTLHQLSYAEHWPIRKIERHLRMGWRTIRKYLPESPGASGGNRRRDQRWSTFLKNHAAAIIACDFFVVASATFRILYVLVVMEHASR